MRDQPDKVKMPGQRAAVPGILNCLLLGLQLAVIMQGCEESCKMHVYTATSFSRRIMISKRPSGWRIQLPSSAVDGCIVCTPELNSLIPDARRYSLGF